MSESESDAFNWGPTLEAPHANQIEILLEAVYVTHDDRPDELGITPRDLESGVLTKWITINADDALDLEDWR